MPIESPHDMASRSTDPEYLKYQYGDAQKLSIRAETHRLYSERPDDMSDWLLGFVGAEPGHLLLDVGCGTGWLHTALVARRVNAVALDLSFGMAQETQRQASNGAFRVAVLQADARLLPMRNASFDRVIATHVFFHVPDVRGALREMRRVLRPGGRMLASTNAADHSQRLYELHADVARSFGYTPTAPAGSHFTLDHLDLVREVFPQAERHVRSDAFMFRNADVAVRFYATGRVDGIQEWRSDGGHRPKLLEAVRERVEAIIAEEGVFRVPKDSGCFVAEV